MNIKTQLTLTMWVLPMALLMVVLSASPYIILTGSVLMLFQTVLWVNLLNEIEQKNK